MPCYHPLNAWRTPGGAGAGAKVWFSPDKYHTEYLQIPCGQCIGCRLERSRQWAVRCLHEASLHQENAFVTLTYAPEHLPPTGSLDRRAFPLFIKRLRQHLVRAARRDSAREGRTIRPRSLSFFHCGEYGTDLGRPHYHALLFNYDFPDKTPWSSRNGYPTWRSQTLEKLWPFGISEIGVVNFQTAAYVARYITTKVTGPQADDHYHGKEPEYCTMSRRPAIALGWLEQYADETFPRDSIIVRGKEAKPPRYYLNQLKQVNPEAFQVVSAARAASRRPDDETPERLRVRETCTTAQLTLRKRGLDS